MHLLEQPTEPDVSVRVPLGAAVDLGERGAGFVRVLPTEHVEPRDPVVLLHGLTASSGINWVHLFEPLARRRTVIAPDLRGHARGPRAARRLSMADNADDVVALLDVLGIERAAVLGYSMGGSVAQELARNHPDRVGSLILVATSPRFRMAPISKRIYGLNAIGARVAGWMPASVRDRVLPRFVTHDDPAVRQLIYRETARHSARQLIRAADALSRFRSTPWLPELEVPTSVVVMTEDKSLHPNVQYRVAELVPDAELFESPTGHSGLLWEHEIAVPVVVDAVDRAQERAGAT